MTQQFIVPTAAAGAGPRSQVSSARTHLLVGILLSLVTIAVTG